MLLVRAWLYILFSLPLVALSQSTVVAYVSTTGSTATATITKPGTTTVGDLIMIGLMYENGADESITVPAGFTTIFQTNNGTHVGMLVCYKVATSFEPGSYSFTLVNGSAWSVGLSLIQDYDMSNPIDVYGSVADNGRNVRPPSITTSNDGELVLCYYTNKEDATYTPHASTVECYDSPNFAAGIPSNMMACFNKAVAGPTGLVDARASRPNRSVGALIAIRYGTTLPVDLIDYSVESLKETVEVRWEVSAEVNNDRFEVWKSTNGLDFYTIGEVQGRGTTNESKKYVFVDSRIGEGESYYQLRQVDFDGKVESFDIKRIDFRKTSNQRILVQNPVQQRVLMLRLEQFSSGTMDYRQEVILDLIALNGKQVFSKSLGTQFNQMTTVSLPLELPPGQYLMRVRKGNAVHTERVLIQ